MKSRFEEALKLLESGTITQRMYDAMFEEPFMSTHWDGDNLYMANVLSPPTMPSPAINSSIIPPLIASPRRWTWVNGEIVVTSYGVDTQINNNSPADFSFGVGSDRIWIGPFAWHTTTRNFADIVKGVEAEMTRHRASSSPITSSPTPLAQYLQTVYSDWRAESMDCNPPCEHEWETKHLFTSSYEVCSQCKIERK